MKIIEATKQSTLNQTNQIIQFKTEDQVDPGAIMVSIEKAI